MQPTLGTISHGTLRIQDLMSAFLGALSEYCPAEYQQLTMPGCGFPAIPDYALEDDKSEWWDSETAPFILEDITQCLEDVSPPYCYFGAHERDGSDFGYWPDWESIQDDDGVTEIPDPAELDTCPTLEAIFINDHGNATLYAAVLGPGGYVTDWREVWSIV